MRSEGREDTTSSSFGDNVITMVYVDSNERVSDVNALTLSSFTVIEQICHTEFQHVQCPVICHP